MTKLALSDLAARERLTYQQAYDRALRGDFGELTRNGRRWFILEKDGEE